ncbi:MAG: hypothetical protein PHU59_02650 [Candidatus Omnitrophica bacterium]|jgi:hypothetical protein|nr:hypothetical protein [Candidatus Omnitrophota bacterium]
MLLKKMAWGICFFLCLTYFFPPLICFADTVVLKSGQVIEGKIIEVTEKYVKINFDGVDVTYFQDEIASINQGNVSNAASKELTSLYEAFNASKNAVEDKGQLNEPAGLTQPAQPAVNENSILLPGLEKSQDPSTTVQAAVSQLPKQYQDLIKSKLQSMQGSASADQPAVITPNDLSSLSTEYQQIIKSSLEKIQADKQTPKN